MNTKHITLKVATCLIILSGSIVCSELPLDYIDFNGKKYLLTGSIADRELEQLIERVNGGDMNALDALDRASTHSLYWRIKIVEGKYSRHNASDSSRLRERLSRTEKEINRLQTISNLPTYSLFLGVLTPLYYPMAPIAGVAYLVSKLAVKSTEFFDSWGYDITTRIRMLKEKASRVDQNPCNLPLEEREQFLQAIEKQWLDAQHRKADQWGAYTYAAEQQDRRLPITLDNRLRSFMALPHHQIYDIPDVQTPRS